MRLHAKCGRGKSCSLTAIVNELRQAGYTTEGVAQASPLGTYSEAGETVTVHPGPQSYHSQDAATIHFNAGVVNALTDDHGQALQVMSLSRC